MVYNDFREIGSIIHKHKKSLYFGDDASYFLNELLGLKDIDNKKNKNLLVEIHIDTTSKRVKENIRYAVNNDLKRSLMIKGAIGNRPRPALTGKINFFETKKRINKDTGEISFNSKLEKTIKNILANKKLYSLESITKQLSPVFETVDIAEKDIEEFYEILNKIIDDKVFMQINEILSNYKRTTKKDAPEYYFTIYVDGKNIADFKAYKYILLTYDFKNIPYRKAVCSCCGKETYVSYKLTALFPNFKLFTTTNACFGDVETGFINKFTPCVDCFVDICHFLVNKDMFTTRMWFFNNRDEDVKVLAYPKFILKKFPDYETLTRLSQKAKDSIKCLEMSSLKSIRSIEDDLLDENKSFLLNFIFFKEDRASTMVINQIEDIPPLRLIDVFRAMNRQRTSNGRYNNLIIHCLKSMIHSKVNIRDEGYNIFIEDKNEAKVFSYKNYFDLLLSVLLGVKVPREMLINSLAKPLQNILFTKTKDLYSYSYKRAVKNAYTTLSFFEDIGCLQRQEKGAEDLFYNRLLKYRDLSFICNDIIEVAEEEGIFDDGSLFYVSLGVLLNNINYKQNKKGNKGILNGFNFKNLSKIRTEEILLNLLEKQNAYAPNEIYNSHLIRVMISYLTNVEDFDISTSERALNLHLGIAIASSKALEKAKKKSKKNSKKHQNIKGDNIK